MNTIDINQATWFTSSYSNHNANCVEVAAGVPGFAPVRDSKAPHGPALTFSCGGWASFVSALRTGDFDA